MKSKKLQKKLNKILPLIFKPSTLNIAGNVSVGSAKLSSDFEINFDLDEIVYIEATNKCTTIHLVGKKSKFLPYSIKKIVELYPELVCVRRRGCENNGPKSSVNSKYGFYNLTENKVEIKVKGEEWNITLIPSKSRKDALKILLNST